MADDLTETEPPPTPLWVQEIQDTPFVTSHNAAGLDRRSLGSYRILEAECSLLFPEPNYSKMVNRQADLLEVMEPLRFIQRAYGWTGHGVHRPPAISASLEGRALHARIHGDVFRDGNGRAYLVDLGEVLEPAKRLRVITESALVDEAQSFKPFFSFTAAPTIERMQLWVAFHSPPSQCDYAYRPLDGAWTEIGPVEPTERDGLWYFYFATFEQKAKAGVHRLSWRPNEASAGAVTADGLRSLV